MDYTVTAFSLDENGRVVVFGGPFLLPEAEFESYRRDASETLRSLNEEPANAPSPRPTHLRIANAAGAVVFETTLELSNQSADRELPGERAYTWGRVVRAISQTPDDDARMVRIFDVGVYGRDEALHLVYTAFPDLRLGYQVEAAEGLPRAAFVSMEMKNGEVRERQL